MPKNNKDILKKPLFKRPLFWVFLAIFTLATIFRFYHFPTRWGLGDDDSRDISIAQIALSRHQLPLNGSFSSAGPFVFGPLFYWLLMASYLIMPFTVTAPWIMDGIFGVLTVGLLALIGYRLGGKKLAIILSLLAATAPQLVIRSLTLGQHTFVAFSASALVLCFILFWQKKNLWWAFLMGISLGAAISFHYESLNLVLFFAAVLIVPGLTWKKRLLGFLLMVIGFIIPSLPIIIWDSKQQWANTRNLLDYFLVGQYRLYVPNSWKLFLFHFLPGYWSFVVGGTFAMGLILMVVTAVVVGLKQVVERRLYNPEKVLLGIFLILLFVNRYYHGERSEGYLLYLAPFILIFTALAISYLISIKTLKWLIPVLSIILLATTLTSNGIVLSQLLSSQSPVQELNKVADIIIAKYPNKKFAVYDDGYHYAYRSQALSAILNMKGKSSPNGMPIGVTAASTVCTKLIPCITPVIGDEVVDLRRVPNLGEHNPRWSDVTPEGMYDSLIGYWQTHKLKATFSLPDFILSKLHLKKS